MVASACKSSQAKILQELHNQYCLNKSIRNYWICIFYYIEWELFLGFGNWNDPWEKTWVIVKATSSEKYCEWFWEYFSPPCGSWAHDGGGTLILLSPVSLAALCHWHPCTAHFLWCFPRGFQLLAGWDCEASQVEVHLALTRWSHYFLDLIFRMYMCLFIQCYSVCMFEESQGR